MDLLKVGTNLLNPESAEARDEPTPQSCYNYRFDFSALHWRHNDHDGVSNHQPHDCLLNRLFRRRSKKTSKLRVTGLCAGNSPRPMNSPHKWPVTRKTFPFDDVIMVFFCRHGYDPTRREQIWQGYCFPNQEKDCLRSTSFTKSRKWRCLSTRNQ